ncbi:helix-turn-helix domain-containing protein [Lentzea pudingi]|nr:helix-turn-helix transcriptional regulator [Lentzea pudingi]
MNDTLGELMRTARTRLTLSGREAARRAGISESRWRQLEAVQQPGRDGELQPVSTTTETVLQIAAALALDPSIALRATSRRSRRRGRTGHHAATRPRTPEAVTNRKVASSSWSAR